MNTIIILIIAMILGVNFYKITVDEIKFQKMRNEWERNFRSLYKYHDKDFVVPITPISDIRTVVEEGIKYGSTKIEYVWMGEYKLNEMLQSPLYQVLYTIALLHVIQYKPSDEVNSLIKKPNLRKIKRYFRKNGLPKIVIKKKK